MKQTQRIFTASFVLAVAVLCSSSVLGQRNGDTPGNRIQPDYTACVNSSNQQCGCCKCSHGSANKDCLHDEGSQTCKNNSPTGVMESAAESFAIIDDDGPAVSPVDADCPSCAGTGANIPEDSQLLRLRLTRIWRSSV